jgi:hypothetical protein
MVNWNIIGSYLGRRVKIAAIISDETVFSNKDISSSILLVYFCSISNSVSIEALLEKLISIEPMAIAFAGESAENVFSSALHFLSYHQTKSHIMTKLCAPNEFPELAEDFLSATWPAEERFDEWDSYSIVLVGCNNSSYSILLTDLQKLID